ncbi:ferrous iron transport protein B [Syntrophotalea acetylenivorans]|uniref:Ferrous iron transport protein B n=1 Tax=Syntrophotalea acetylenivorans TaxID=1842532 RepID=A0A1L3GMH0_9BACT|nr:ferrous iron transport protein B [Syntrophotalea acetylenivorans]APG27137.1 ferrous iron transport protein B [Syntrophotalea acetylenivorans]
MEQRSGCGCQGSQPCEETGLKNIVMVGNPNVGKSALFNRLTNSYVVVSNYPGTTVEVSRGKCRIGNEEFIVNDTPGMYSLLPITEEERVSRDILRAGKADVVLHVVDAKNLKRMLSLTLQLVEADLPVVLVLNMIDEAERLGIQIDTALLEKRLGIPVVAISALSGHGVDTLKEEIVSYRHPKETPEIYYGDVIDGALNALAPILPSGHGLSQRALALLLIQGDAAIAEEERNLEGNSTDFLDATLAEMEENLEEPASYAVPMMLHQSAVSICKKAFAPPAHKGKSFANRLSGWTMRPLTGVPILLLVLYFGLYKFVGEFGAGTIVDFLEADIFEVYVNPWINGLLSAYVPWQPLRELIGMDYGIVTLGIRYAIAIILPIVGTFFIAFSIIEDTGYLPRLALLVDRIFKKIGLNGRAVIPMTLGFGCDTMATMVTRTLETKRERIIATLLLALAIPCSAQLGVILGMVAEKPAAMAVWGGFILLIFLFIGFLTARLMPGDRPNFYMEVPPLRMPRPGAVFMKTYTRMQWYFVEILPLFILASVLIWLGKITATFDVVVSWLSHVMSWIGLPKEAAVAFLFGFFRRDYGAAGLFDLQQAGALTGNQLAVAVITLTLFVPCVAQFLIMKKERGLKMASAIALFIFPFAFLVGGMVNVLLNLTGIQL